jgi:glycine cleavage system aminomethyltransferase T
MSYSLHIGPNIRKSPYFEATVAAGVRSFSVYNHMYIPGSFGDPDAEYDRLLTGVAQWDVAAQRQVELRGPDAAALAQYLTTRDISRTAVGQARYVAICDHDGMLINDPVMLKLAEDRFWFSIADSDIELWAKAVARERGMDVEVFEADASPMAIQGPKSFDVAESLFGAWIRDLKHFWFRETELDGIPLVLCRAGWSKQGGFELYLTDQTRGTELWTRVAEAGAPFGIGPGAPNDTERLESGLLSYGADCRRQTFPANPLELGLERIVDLDGEDFIGRDALRKVADEGPRRRYTGFYIDGPPVAGNQHPLPILSDGEAVGLLCEMAYSRRLGRNIGLGLIDIGHADGNGLSIPSSGEPRALSISPLPFPATT